MEKKRESIWKNIWVITKYQLFTKMTLLLVIIPIYKKIFSWALKSTGRVSITSGDFIPFFTSVHGWLTVAVTVLIVMILVAVDLNSNIIMAAAMRDKVEKISCVKIFLEGVKSLKKLLNIGGMAVILFICAILPLANIAISLSAFKGFKIPNFITSVIYANPLYLIVYISVLALFTIISALSVFTLHFMLLKDYKAGKAVKSSWSMVKRHYKRYIKRFLLFNILIVVVIFAVTISLIAIMYIGINDVSLTNDNDKFLFILYTLTLSEILYLTVFLSIPLTIKRLTALFYEFCEKDDLKIAHIDSLYHVRQKAEKRGLRIKPTFKISLSIALIFAVNVFMAAMMTMFFDDFFLRTAEIDVIAHRGGGVLSAENSLDGIEKAQNVGAKWTEIDVQRTKDGKYIINHDNNFVRLSGEEKTSSQLTLDEIKGLKIRDMFNSNRPSQSIPTLDEVLDRAKGNIGVFIELKGATADEKMVDDTVAMIKARGMENEAVIISLDYSIIKYIEDRYPHIKSGFLYYFSFGDFTKLKGDYLIMEESEAKEENIEAVHNAGKKAIVWTVNSAESIEKFVDSNVDGIITDKVTDVKEAMEHRNQKTPAQIVLDTLLI